MCVLCLELVIGQTKRFIAGHWVYGKAVPLNENDFYKLRNLNRCHKKGAHNMLGLSWPFRLQESYEPLRLHRCATARRKEISTLDEAKSALLQPIQTQVESAHILFLRKMHARVC